MDLSQQINLSDIDSGRAFRLSWLRQHGLRIDRQSLRLQTRGFAASACNRLTTTNPTWNGHNASGWKSDLISVNGFDERMRYGGEDCELGERLVNIGIKPIQIRFSAICLHLDHERGYVNDSDRKRNMQIRQSTRHHRVLRTEFGIRQFGKRAA